MLLGTMANSAFSTRTSLNDSSSVLARAELVEREGDAYEVFLDVDIFSSDVHNFKRHLFRIGTFDSR